MVDSVDSSPSIDPIIAARYMRIEKLAAEGLDPRYLAQRVDTGALVELQVLSADRVSDDTLLRALRDQAARAAGVSGQRLPIATVFEYDRTTDGKLVLAMDHPRGPTLRDTLKDTTRREGTLPFERALQFALQIAEALELAHSVGLVHGGLRPENVVLVGPEPAITLAHFGVDGLLSRSMGPSEKVASPYQAPEQASGETTERSDIYALGAILYEMLGGTPPSTGTANRRRIEPQAWKTRRGEISAGLERLITQSLEAVPAQRPSNISVVCNDLMDALNLHRRHRAGHEAQGEPAAALPEGQGRHRPARRARPRRIGHRRVRQHPLFYILGGLVLLIVIIGLLAQQQIGWLAQSIGSVAQQQIDSLVQFIGSHVQQPTGAVAPQPTGSVASHSKSSEHRPEEKKTAAEAKADARVERDLKETKTACRDAAQARLKAPLTASFVYDDVGRIRGKEAYVRGSVDVPNGFSAKLRNRYACELARREQGGWQVTKVVFESR